MRVWGGGKKIPGIYGIPKGYLSQSEKDTSHNGVSFAKDSQGSAELDSKIVALNRFVSRATDKCLPFFRTLRKLFEGSTESQQAFEVLKAYLSSPPLLSPSKPEKEQFLYLVISLVTVSAALVKEDDGV